MEGPESRPRDLVPVPAGKVYSDIILMYSTQGKQGRKTPTALPLLDSWLLAG